MVNIAVWNDIRFLYADFVINLIKFMLQTNYQLVAISTFQATYCRNLLFINLAKIDPIIHTF